MDKLRGIVFDCDGVLFESRSANLAYYNHVLQHFGESPVEASDHVRAHLCHTAASPNVFSELLGEARTADALAFAAGVDYRRFIPYMTPEPGMRRALSSLSRVYPLAVATNRGYSMPAILAHFELSEYFVDVVTSHDVKNPKPAPDMLYEVAARLGFATHELLFVGDSELDQAAARSAGMPFAIYRGEIDAEMKIAHHDDLVTMLFSG